MPEGPAQTLPNPGPGETGQIPTHPVSGEAGQTPPIPVPEEPGQTPPSPVAPGCTPSANAPASALGRTPAVDHDWVFKNLVQDYPQAALAFFAAGEKIGLDDDIEITFLGQEPPEEQMTEGKQILDVPMRVRWRDGSREDLVILLEEETIPSRFNPERLLSYTVRVMRREGTRRALPIVICLKRVGAPVARTAYTDISAPRPSPMDAPAGIIRDRGAGRPTKKERRQLDALRSAPSEIDIEHILDGERR